MAIKIISNSYNQICLILTVLYLTKIKKNSDYVNKIQIA